MRILIVKTSSFGDVLQSLNVLKYLKYLYPNSKIDWVVQKKCFDKILESNELIDKVITFQNVFKIKDYYKNLREKKYDVVFDLQGNCKSAIFTFLARSKNKVGFSLSGVSEWPNILATNVRYDIKKDQNIRGQYLELIFKYFEKEDKDKNLENFLKISKFSKNQNISKSLNILIAPFSRWPNKEIKISTLLEFLKRIDKNFKNNKIFYYFLWGNEEERKKALLLKENFQENGKILEKMDFLDLKNFIIKNVNLVISVDSCILHLCESIDNISTFSIFGPSSSFVYKPLGENHFSFQNKINCLYKEKFIKRCKKLRCCQDAKCMKDIDVDKLFEQFKTFYEK
jgi:heptosyltransferase-1